MDTVLEKCSDRSRSLLFGLLLSCLFSDEAQHKCPLALLRNNLSLEEKYDYVLNLSKEEVNNILKKHGKCFEKRIQAIM